MKSHSYVILISHPTLSLSLSLRIRNVRQLLQSYLLPAEISSEKPDLIILKRDLEVKHVDLVSPLQQTFCEVTSQEATPTHHCTHLAL